MEKLTEQQVVQLIREEYQKKVQEVVDELDAFASLGGHETGILSTGLKIREEKSGLLYTIETVRPEGVQVGFVTSDGEKKTSFIANDELRSRYKLD